MKIAELFAELSFKSDQTKLKEFISNLGDLNMRTVMSAAGLGAIYEVTKNIMDGAVAAAIPIEHFTKVTGQSGTELQKWTYFAKQAGIEGDLIAQSIGGLQNSVAKMRLTGEGAQGFLFMGINPIEVLKTKSYFDLLGMILDRLKSYSPEYQRLALQQIGMSDQLILLKDRWSEINTQVKLNGAEVERIMEYHKQLSRFGEDWRTSLSKVGAGPIGKWLGSLAGDFADLLEGHPFRGMWKDINNPNYWNPSSNISPAGNITKTVKITAPITITGATDPEAVGRQVKEHLSNALQEADTNSTVRNN